MVESVVALGGGLIKSELRSRYLLSPLGPAPRVSSVLEDSGDRLLVQALPRIRNSNDSFQELDQVTRSL